MVGGSAAASPQVIFITGCSDGGIGQALALAFASKGCSVVATARSIGSMKNLHADSRFFLHQLDVNSEDSVRYAVAAAMAEFGRIDVLVNNAGMHLVAPLVETPLPSVQQVFQTNLYGPLRVIQAVAPHMIVRKKGKIVNVGSVTALAPGPWAGVYSSSKSALHALTDTLRLELMPFNIKVVNLVPGAIESNLGKNSTSTYRSMPEWKLYEPFEGLIRSRATISQDISPTPAAEFAEKAVALLLRENPPTLFSYGRLSTIFAILYHLPDFLEVWFYRFVVKSC